MELRVQIDATPDQLKMDPSVNSLVHVVMYKRVQIEQR